MISRRSRPQRASCAGMNVAWSGAAPSDGPGAQLRQEQFSMRTERQVAYRAGFFFSQALTRTRAASKIRS